MHVEMLPCRVQRVQVAKKVKYFLFEVHNKVRVKFEYLHELITDDLPSLSLEEFYLVQHDGSFHHHGNQLGEHLRVISIQHCLEKQPV